MYVDYFWNRAKLDFRLKENARRYVMANKRNLSMSEDDYDDDVDTWEPTEDYPTKKSWKDDNWDLMYPNGIDDGEYFDD